MKKILNASVAAIALLLALSFFLPIFSYTHATLTNGTADAEKFYIYSFSLSQGVSYFSTNNIYILAALALGVGALFSNFKNKSILSAALLTVASLLCIFTLLPIGQEIKKMTSSDSYAYSLGAGYYIIFILAVLLIVAEFIRLILTALRDSVVKATTVTDTETKIKHLVGLKNEGILTQEEFSILISRLKP